MVKHSPVDRVGHGQGAGSVQSPMSDESALESTPKGCQFLSLLPKLPDLLQ